MNVMALLGACSTIDANWKIPTEPRQILRRPSMWSSPSSTPLCQTKEDSVGLSSSIAALAEAEDLRSWWPT